MINLTREELARVNGGAVSAETIACAVGGAIGAVAGATFLGPFGAAIGGGVGCVALADIVTADKEPGSISELGPMP